jgi:molybdenum cofactor biosynthesis protein B
MTTPSESTLRHKATAPKKLSFGVYICSTSRYQATVRKEEVEDVSGSLIENLLRSAGYSVLFKKIIPDDQKAIAESVKEALENPHLDAVIYSGGTGIALSDVTIETVTPFLEKTLPGFGEIFRRISYDEAGSAAVLSRAVAGVARGKVFYCLPGSPDAARLAVERLILPETPHIVRHARE